MNINKLRGKIVEQGLNVEKVAFALGVDKATLYRKMHANGETLTIKEVNKLCEILNISKVEAMDIFFKDFVA